MKIDVPLTRDPAGALASGEPPGAPTRVSLPAGDALPEAVWLMLRERLAQDEMPEAAVYSDLSKDSYGGKPWLILTNRQILVITEAEGGPDAGPWQTLPVNGIEKLVRRDFHGLYRLEAHLPERAIVLADYTQARLEAFEEFLRLARARLLPGENAPSIGTDASDRKETATRFRPRPICPSCGKPFPKRLGACPDCLPKAKLLLRLFGRMKAYRLPIVGSLALMLVMTGIEMTQPLLTMILIDHVFPDKNMGLFLWVIGGLISIHIFGAVFSGTRSYLMSWLGETIVYDLRKDLYRHLHALSLDFYDQKETGWIMDRVTADTGNLQNFLAESLQEFLRDVMTVVVIISIMFAMHWQLALITLLPSPLLVWVTMRFVKRIRLVYQNQARKRSRIASLLSGVLPGVRVVKSFAQEGRETERYLLRNREYMAASLRVSRIFSTFHPTTNFLTVMGVVLTWSFGGYLVISGRGVTLGTLIAFIAYLWRFYGPLNNLARLSNKVQHALTSAYRVFEVLDREPEVRDPGLKKALPSVIGKVAFRDVTFGYDATEPVLKAVSFTAEPGEMIGLVGPSGAGKSTTINLLCRFYDVNAGAIEIDGNDVRDVTLDSLRSQIGVVLQESFLFHGSIAQNIAYGKPDAAPEDIIAAARMANAHEFIMRFTDAYDTMVGERGQRLSGGERQRISIARAILKNPRILILDEATSSVDTESEALIREALDRLVKGRTTFAIAHRFSTLRNADRLVVLDRGQVVETGTHEELLAKEDGLFKRLCDMQMEISKIVAVGE